MEIRARYALIGAFILAAIGAGFTFVYWLNTAGGLGQRTHYRIAFDGPIAGLLRGSAVLFNGIRVGEVTALQLDAAKPETVTAAIAIDPRAPVRADTRVGIEFQGLTGAPVVSLVGGLATSPQVIATMGEPPLLVAEKNAGQGMSQAARDVLRRIDTVVADNAAPLHSLINNIDKFSGALARNSDRVDGIAAGLQRLTGGGAAKVQPHIYDLAAVRTFPPLLKVPSGQLIVSEPTTLSLYETEKILVWAAEGEGTTLDRGQWPDLLPKVLQARIVQSFENAGYARVLGRGPDTVKADHQLLIELRRFLVSAGNGSNADVEFGARIVDANGRIIDTRIFRRVVSVKSLEGRDIAAALGEAFTQVVTELVLWTSAAI